MSNITLEAPIDYKTQANIVPRPALAVFDLPITSAGGTTFTGSGNGTPAVAGWRMATGTTASSTALYRANPTQLISFDKGGSNSRIDFSKPVWWIFRTQFSIPVGGVLQAFLGGLLATDTTVQQMQTTNTNFSGIGVELLNGNIRLQSVYTPNGSGGSAVFSNPIVATYTQAAPNSVEFRIYSDATGKIKLWVNDVFITELPYGPTLSTGTGVCQARIALANNGANECFTDLAPGALTVIVE